MACALCLSLSDYTFILSSVAFLYTFITYTCTINLNYLWILYVQIHTLLKFICDPKSVLVVTLSPSRTHHVQLDMDSWGGSTHMFPTEVEDTHCSSLQLSFSRQMSLPWCV